MIGNGYVKTCNPESVSTSYNIESPVIYCNGILILLNRQEIMNGSRLELDSVNYSKIHSKQ